MGIGEKKTGQPSSTQNSTGTSAHTAVLVVKAGIVMVLADTVYPTGPLCAIILTVQVPLGSALRPSKAIFIGERPLI